jgi:thiamine-phosphate pyrophosphorylase
MSEASSVPQLYLILPRKGSAGDILPRLSAVLANHACAAVLVPAGERAEAAYKALVKAVRSAVQSAGSALIIEGDPGLVRLLGADGLHVTTGIEGLRDALTALRPEFIVGAGDARTRHDAMAKGELELDYILFGPLSGSISSESREMARWWAETMEIPGVLADPDGDLGDSDTEGCEFLGIGLAALERS